MTSNNKALLQDETIVFKCTRHWAAFLPTVFWIFCTFVALDLSGELKLMAIITGVFALSNLLKAAQQYYFYKCLLTTKRMIIYEGWFNSHSTEIFLQKIDSFKIEQPLFGKLLGYGTLIIIGAAGSQHQFVLLNDPIYFTQRIQRQLEKTLKQFVPAM